MRVKPFSEAMGLDMVCTCGRSCLRLSYSSFFSLRAAVALAHGYDYNAMYFGPRGVLSDQERACRDHAPALYAFLTHPDCEGVWSPADARVVGPMLRAVLDHPAIARAGSTGISFSSKAAGNARAPLVVIQETSAKTTWRPILLELVEGLAHASESGHTLCFC